MPGGQPGEFLPPGVAPPQASMPTDVNAAIAKATGPSFPIIEPSRPTSCQLIGGIITPDNQLIQSASVRELNGYDEEKLARVDMMSNVANYVTELLTLGVELIGSEAPTRETIRGLLLGDRDTLVLAIRQATYGNEVDFEMDCDACGEKSTVIIDLNTDIKVKEMTDPLVRSFEVQLRKGMAKVELLTGYAQEAFSESVSKKVRTQAEVSTLMLARSVVEINGSPTFAQENAVRALSSADRKTLLDFITDIQPGPLMQEPIPVNCATCGKEFPISLGLGNLFRF